MGNLCVRGGLHPNPNACWPVSSQLGAGHERAPGVLDQVDHADRGTVSHLHQLGGMLPWALLLAAALRTRPAMSPLPSRPLIVAIVARRAPGPWLVDEQCPDGQHTHSGLAREAWRWAMANRNDHGALPSGKRIAHGQKQRCGRLVKSAGSAGVYDARALPNGGRSQGEGEVWHRVCALTRASAAAMPTARV